MSAAAVESPSSRGGGVRQKAARCADEWRRMREAKTAALQRRQRVEYLKRRRLGPDAFADELPYFDTAASADSLLLAPTTPVEKLLTNLPALAEMVYSDDNTLQLKVMSQFVRILAVERSPSIDEVIATGVVPRFTEFLTKEDFPHLQYEAAWALTNVASGTPENTKVVIDHGAVPIFVKLLGSGNDDLREQAVWALGNISGDSAACRDHVLANGALVPLLLQLNARTRLSMLRSTTWTLSSLCGGKPSPPFEQIKLALPALERLIYSNDEEVLTDACRALTHLSDGTSDRIQAVIDAGVCPRLVELLLHPSPCVLTPALRTIGNFVSGDDKQTQHVINHQVLPILLNFLTHNHKKAITKEACWIISNITAGNEDQIQAVVDAGIMAPLLHLLHSAEMVIKKEAAWAISNAISGGTHSQIKNIVSHGCIRSVCELLSSPDASLVKLSLGILENILKAGETEKNLGYSGGKNPYAELIYQAEGVEKIENLQGNNDAEVYEKAMRILETYFPGEEHKGMVTAPSGLHLGSYSVSSAPKGFLFG